jgi:hypothetical protein
VTRWRSASSLASIGREATSPGYIFSPRGSKRSGWVLHEMVPKATTIAVLVNPDYSPSENQLRDVQ